MELIYFSYRLVRGTWILDLERAAEHLKDSRSMMAELSNTGKTCIASPAPSEADYTWVTSLAGAHDFHGARKCAAGCEACYKCLVAQQVMCLPAMGCMCMQT